MAAQSKTFERWKRDPVAFISEVLRNPQTGAPFELYLAQVEFLRRAFTLTSEGRLPYPEIIRAIAGPRLSGAGAHYSN